MDLTCPFLQGDKGAGPVRHRAGGAEDRDNGRAAGDAPWHDRLQGWVDLASKPSLRRDGER